MACRGFYGFIIDGQEKIGYGQDMADPRFLGQTMLRWLNTTLTADLDVVGDRLRLLRVVDGKGKPSAQDIAELNQWRNLNAGTRSDDDWYCLLRHSQGNPTLTMAARTVLSAVDFAVEGLWVDWGYVADFDTNRFEVYQGQRHRPDIAGRFAGRGEPDAAGNQWTSALVRSWPFAKLPSEKTFLANLRAMSSKQLQGSNV